MANALVAASRSLIGPIHSGVRRQASYGGAQGGRLYADWTASNLSPDIEIRMGAWILRARARQLVRDNAYAAGFVDELANNVVGVAGITPEAQVKTLEGLLHDPTNDQIEAAWADFCNPENVSADGIDDMVAVQRLAIQTLAVDGEAFFRKLPYFDNDHYFALTQIDADRVDAQYNVAPSVAGGSEIRLGIEIDGFGKPLAYHVWTRHPTEVGVKLRERIPADEMIHLFVRMRPGQTRGVSWFAPVLTSIKMLDGYTEAELVAARTAAAKMGFIVTKDPANAVPRNPDDEESDRDRMMNAEAGAIDELDPGQEFQQWDPQHPSTAMATFTNIILRGISRGVGMSYFSFTGDLTGANFSSIRAGILPERDKYRGLHGFMAVRFCRPVYRSWVTMARLAGVLKVDGRITSDLSLITWQGRGWAWVDPLKDVQATILGIQHGLDSRTDALAEEGKDVRKTFRHLAEESELAEEEGIDINPVAPPVAGKGMGAPTPTDNEEGGDQQNKDEDTDKSNAVLPQFRHLVALS